MNFEMNWQFPSIRPQRVCLSLIGCIVCIGLGLLPYGQIFIPFILYGLGCMDFEHQYVSIPSQGSGE